MPPVATHCGRGRSTRLGSKMEPMVFFFDSVKIRALELRGSLWVVGRDLAEALGYPNPTLAITKLLWANVSFYGRYDACVVCGTLYTILRTDAAIELLSTEGCAIHLRDFLSQILEDWSQRILSDAYIDHGSSQAHTDLRLVDLEIQLASLSISHDRASIEIAQLKMHNNPLNDVGKIKRAVFERVRWLTKRGYSASYSQLFGELNRKYQVSTYKEIPSGSVKDALLFIQKWQPTAMPTVRQLDLFA